MVKAKSKRGSVDTLPKLSAEQQAAALSRAMEVRQARARVCRDLGSGAMGIEQVLNSDDVVCTRLSVERMLRSMPGVGKIRAARMMADIGISANRRVGGLGERQRAALIERFGK